MNKGDNVRFGVNVAIVLGLLSAAPAMGAITQIDIPPSREQGLDMILVDEGALPPEPELARQAALEQREVWSGNPTEISGPAHPFYTELRAQFVRYHERWSALPQLLVATPDVALVGASDPRLAVLRQRLGLAKQGGMDKALQARLSQYQQAHGLRPDGKAGPETLASLNRGAAYYERLILLNMDRARRLPTTEYKGKYLLVDAGSARLWLYEDGRAVDDMKVVVGAPASETPMVASMLRYSSVNPYWNVPPDLVRTLIAPRVLAQGMIYLTDRGYQVLDGWTEDAPLLDASKVDWQAVADGTVEIRVRQLPGGGNSMGAIKFMMPNDFGIYLHDTPNKAMFSGDQRWVSNGCIRLEDAPRLARWLYGEMPTGTSPDSETRVELQQPVPVYVTYFTVGADGRDLAFRKDPYQRDARLMARYGGDGSKMVDPDEEFRNAMRLTG